MCSLFVLLGVEPDFPILVGANRDEMRDRSSSPPGLFVGQRRRMLSPRDRRAGGTWMAVNDRLWFAALTNVTGGNRFPQAPSRGELPHLALDVAEFEDVVPTIAATVRARPFNDFRLLVTDGSRSVVFRHVERDLRIEHPATRTLTLTNEHDLGVLAVADLEGVREPVLGIEQRLERLADLLLDEGSRTGHRVLKTSESYGTVSSSVLAVPRLDPRRLVWRYAQGIPGRVPYRDYGNLGRRLVEG